MLNLYGSGPLALWEFIAYPTSTPSFARGGFGFSGIYTSIFGATDGSTDRAQFLLTPTTATYEHRYDYLGGANTVNASNFPPISNLRRSYFGSYIQDDWHAFQSVTINLGLRWERYGVPSEKDNRQANFVPGSSATPNVGAVSYPNLPGLRGSAGISKSVSQRRNCVYASHQQRSWSGTKT